MEVGELRHRVKFLFPLQGRDDTTGAEKQTIIESAEVWASVEFTAIGSDEMNTADKITPMTAAKFTIRYKTGINTEMQILHDGLKYKILSVLPDAKRCYLQLETVQVGSLREMSLVEADGQTLVDAAGNAFVWGANADDDANYTPPALIFTNDSDEEFTME